jgi:hypothetical protein
LIVPIRSLPLSVAIALRNASSASGPGIASSGILAQEASCSLASSLANSGTEFFEPSKASRLQATAFSPAGASDRSNSISFCSFSFEGAFSSSARTEVAAKVITAASRATKRVQ